jgi:pyridoxal biosynthesis lyase PdxS
MDPEYERQMSECAKAAAKMFQGIAQTTPKVKFGDPVQFEPGVLGDVPTYARLNQYARAERAVALAYMAHAVLPKDAANAITVALIADVPALQAAVAIQASRKNQDPGYRTSSGAIA